MAPDSASVTVSPPSSMVTTGLCSRTMSSATTLLLNWDRSRFAHFAERVDRFELRRCEHSLGISLVVLDRVGELELEKIEISDNRTIPQFDNSRRLIAAADLFEQPEDSLGARILEPVQTSENKHYASFRGLISPTQTHQ